MAAGTARIALLALPLALLASACPARQAVAPRVPRAAPGRRAEPHRPRPRHDAHGDRLPPGALGRLGTTRLKHRNVSQLCFAPDGKILASVAGRSLRLWDTASGRLLRELTARSTIRRAAFSHDGALLAAASTKSIAVWQTATGRLVKTLAKRKGDGPDYAFFHGAYAMPGGRHLLAVIHDKLQLRGLKPGARSRQIVTISSRIDFVDVSADGALAAIGDEQKKAIYLHELKTGAKVRTLVGHSQEPKAVAFAAGDALASISAGELLLWKRTSSAPYRRLAISGFRAYAVAAATDARRVAAAGYVDTTSAKKIGGSWSASNIAVWDLERGQRLRALLGPSYEVNAVALSRRGDLLATAGNGQAVVIWDLRSGRPRHPFAGHDHTVTAIAASPDGKRVASIAEDSTLRLWDARTLEQLSVQHSEKQPLMLQFEALHFRGDSAALLAASQHCTVARFGAGGERAASWKLPRGRAYNYVVRMRIDASGRYLGAASDKELRLWDLRQRSHVRALRTKQFLDRLAFAPHGRTVAAVGLSRAIHLWDVASGAHLRTIAQKVGIGALAFSPDGRLLAASGEPEGSAFEGYWAIQLFDVASGKLRRWMVYDNEKILALAFSPDGELLAAGDEGGVVRLWRVATGEHLRAYKGHAAAVTALRFSADGKRIYSGSADTTILVWRR